MEGLSAAERIEWLAVACELDRVQFQLAARPTLAERIIAPLVEELVPLLPSLPGKIGAWSRGIVGAARTLGRIKDALFPRGTSQRL